MITGQLGIVGFGLATIGPAQDARFEESELVGDAEDKE